MARKRSRKRRKQRRTNPRGEAGSGRRREGISSDIQPDIDPISPTRGRPDPAPRRGGGPPPAPWGSFPLSEIVVLVGIVLLVGGFFIEPPRGPVMIGAGLVLGSLAGLELSAREHFAGYRSHTLLLGGAAGVAVLAGLLALTELNPGICAGASVAVFGLCAWLLAGAFRKRSGGALFRFGAGR